MASAQTQVEMERRLMNELPHALPELLANDLKTSFNEVDYIGSGSFGAVRRCYHDRLGEVAVKCTELTGTPEDMICSWNSFKTEAHVLARINHPNIVEVCAVTTWNSNVGLILEYVGGKTLANLIKDKQIQFSRSTGLQLIHQLSAAINYLHTLDSQKKFTHGDIKASNILITPQFVLKLADFGAANVRAATGCQSSSLTLDISTVHTLLYSAPEILNGEGYNEHARDVYSFAVVTYEIVTERLASDDFLGMNSLALIGAIKDEQRPDAERFDANDPMKSIVVSCWSQNPSNRPKIKNVEEEVRGIIKDEFGDETETNETATFEIPEPSQASNRVGLDQFFALSK